LFISVLAKVQTRRVIY